PVARVHRPEADPEPLVATDLQRIRVIRAAGRAAERRPNADDAIEILLQGVELAVRLFRLQRRETEMVPRMVADLVALTHHPAEQLRMLAGLDSYDEEGRAYVPTAQHIQDRRAGARMRPVIECQGNRRRVRVRHSLRENSDSVPTSHPP